jgi:hypothetical protein
MALVNPNIALAGTPMQVPNFLGMQQTAAATQNTLASTGIMQEEAARASETATYNTALTRSKDALRFVNTPEAYLAWTESSLNDPVLGPALQNMGVDRQKALASAMEMLRQPGGLQTAIGKSASSIDQLAQSMTQQGSQARTQAQAQAEAAAANARAAQQDAQVQAVLSGQGRDAPVATATPVPPPVNTLATPSRGVSANALSAPPMSAAEEIAQTYAPVAPAAAPVGETMPTTPPAAPTPPPVAELAPAAPADVATEINNLVTDIGRLRQLAAAGNKQAGVAADQLQKQLELLNKQNPTLSASDRFTPVGKNIFDKSLGRFIEPPTPDEVENLAPALEKGERWNPDTQRVELVPGSTRYNKRRDEHTQSLQVVKGIEDKVGNGVKRLDEILDPKNSEALQGNFGGYNAYVTRLKSGPNSDMRVKLEEFKSDMASAGLELIRQGGSIGQMTEKEWPIVSGLIGQLDPVLGEAEAIRMMNEIRGRFQRIINNANELYDEQWSGTQFYKERDRSNAGAGGAITVTAPNGQTFTFSSQAAADKFKQATGIQ